MERNFGTWQGRLPQELRLAGVKTLEEANGFLRESYLEEFNRRFTVPTAQPGSAFLSLNGQDLGGVFSLQHERVVGQDNTVKLGERVCQIERTSWRGTLAGCRVLIREHLDGQVTISYGPHVVGRYTAEGVPLPTPGSLSATQKRREFGGGLAFPPASPPWQQQNSKRTDHVLRTDISRP